MAEVWHSQFQLTRPGRDTYIYMYIHTASYRLGDAAGTGCVAPTDT